MTVDRPRALSEAPPMLTAKQAEHQCTRAQLVYMSKKGLWRDFYLVLRGADLYGFKELNSSSKPTIITRIDTVRLHLGCVVE